MTANRIAPTLEFNPSATPTRWCPVCQTACSAMSTGPLPAGRPQGFACTRCGAIVAADRSLTMRRMEDLLAHGERSADLRSQVIELEAALRELAEATSGLAHAEDASVEVVRLDVAARTAWQKAVGITRDANVKLAAPPARDVERLRLEKEVQKAFGWKNSGSGKHRFTEEERSPEFVRDQVLQKERKLAEQRAARAVVEHFEEVG